MKLNLKKSKQEYIIALKMAHIRIPTDEEYINDFHKKWNEACMRERERTQSMSFSHEYAKAQSDRLEKHCRMSEEEYRNKVLETGKDERPRNKAEGIPTVRADRATPGTTTS